LKERAASLGGLKPAPLVFWQSKYLFARDEGREPSTDDDLGPLRESARSPSSGEVCLEVCSRHCSLCLHLFFSTDGSQTWNLPREIWNL